MMTSADVEAIRDLGRTLSPWEALSMSTTMDSEDFEAMMRTGEAASAVMPWSQNAGLAAFEGTEAMTWSPEVVSAVMLGSPNAGIAAVSEGVDMTARSGDGSWGDPYPSSTPSSSEQSLPAHADSVALSDRRAVRMTMGTCRGRTQPTHSREGCQRF